MNTVDQNSEDANTKYPHLNSSMLPLLGASVAERVRAIWTERFIPHDAAMKVLAVMKAVYESPKGIRPRCAAIVGSTGAGKSTLIREYVRLGSKAHKFELDGDEYIPILVVDVPERAGAGSLGLATARALGLEGHERSKNKLVADTVYRSLAERRVELVIFNEWHNVRTSEAREREVVYDFVRGITNNHISVIVVGTEQVIRLCAEDEQLAARMRVTWLPVFENDDHFMDFLHTLESYYPLPEPSNLGDEDMAKAIFRSTKGNMNEIVLLCNGAAEWAVKNNKTHITLEALVAGRPAPAARRNGGEKEAA